eukprot:gene23459-biopygen22312
MGLLTVPGTRFRRHWPVAVPVAGQSLFLLLAIRCSCCWPVAVPVAGGRSPAPPLGRSGFDMSKEEAPRRRRLKGPRRQRRGARCSAQEAVPVGPPRRAAFLDTAATKDEFSSECEDSAPHQAPPPPRSPWGDSQSFSHFTSNMHSPDVRWKLRRVEGVGGISKRRGGGEGNNGAPLSWINPRSNLRSWRKLGIVDSPLGMLPKVQDFRILRVPTSTCAFTRCSVGVAASWGSPASVGGGGDSAGFPALSLPATAAATATAAAAAAAAATAAATAAAATEAAAAAATAATAAATAAAVAAAAATAAAAAAAAAVAAAEAAAAAWRRQQQQQQHALRPHEEQPFRCPISLELMVDPVITMDGHTFDRHSIERHWGKTLSLARRRECTIDNWAPTGCRTSASPSHEGNTGVLNFVLGRRCTASLLQDLGRRWAGRAQGWRGWGVVLQFAPPRVRAPGAKMILLTSGSSLAFQRLSRRSVYWRECVGLPNAISPEQGRAPIHGVYGAETTLPASASPPVRDFEFRRAARVRCRLPLPSRSLGETAPRASGARPARVRFFKFCRAARVRCASGARPLSFLPGGTAHWRGRGAAYTQLFARGRGAGLSVVPWSLEAWAAARGLRDSWKPDFSGAGLPVPQRAGCSTSQAAGKLQHRTTVWGSLDPETPPLGPGAGHGHRLVSARRNLAPRNPGNPGGAAPPPGPERLLGHTGRNCSGRVPHASHASHTIEFEENGHVLSRFSHRSQRTWWRAATARHTWGHRTSPRHARATQAKKDPYSPRHARAMPAPRPRQCPVTPGHVPQA